MSSQQQKKKVVIIGLDGVRPDTVQVAKTPNLHDLAQKGYYSWNTQTEIHTISGPAWTSLLTGVHFEKHKVTDNDFKPRDMKYQTIYKLAKDWNPQLKCVAHSHWEPIISEIFEKNVLDIKSTGGDKKMAFRLAKDIEKDKGDLYFIQMDDGDAAGHKYTYSPEIKEYREEIELLDSYVGQILSAIKKRPLTEEWLIIVVSDHGGSGKSHGLPIMDCINIVMIFAGQGFSLPHIGEIPYNANEEEYPMIIDVVPTIAKFLQMPSHPEWEGTARI